MSPMVNQLLSELFPVLIQSDLEKKESEILPSDLDMLMPKFINVQPVPNLNVISHFPAKSKTPLNAQMRAVPKLYSYKDTYHSAIVRATRFSYQQCLQVLQSWTQRCCSSPQTWTALNHRQLSIWLLFRSWNSITWLFFKTKSILSSKIVKEQSKTTSKLDSSWKILDAKTLQLFLFQHNKDITLTQFANRFVKSPFQREILLCLPKWSLSGALMSTNQGQA